MIRFLLFCFASIASIAATIPDFPVTIRTNITREAGTIIYWNHSGFFWTNSPAGTNGQVLTWTNGVPTWKNSAGGGGGAGTVTSVGLSLPSILTVSGSPVTGAGTLTGTLATQAANQVWAGPTTGADATPTFRAVVDNDIPNTITIDLAAVATVANSGDSATAFFSSGTIEDARIDSALARDAEVAAAYQPLATRLTRLAAGVQTLEYSGSPKTNIALTASAGTHFRVALTNLVGLECQISNPTGGVDGDQITVELIQSASGGSVLSLASKFDFGDDIFAFSQNTNALKRDFIRAVYNSTDDKWYVIGLPRGY